MAATFIVSVSPHLRAHDNTARVMRAVSISLVPAALASIYIFGWRALLVMAVSIAVSVAAEVLSQLVFKRKITVQDGSAVVTGLLLAFTLPVQTPIWMVAAGAFTAIFLVKQLFGGIGHNIFNPALAARAVLLASFPVAMTAWSTPVLALGRVDATAAASALGMVKEAAKAGTAVSMPYGSLDLLLGAVPGSLGEVCKAALLLGAAFLLIRRIIDWRIPLTFIGSVALLTFVVGKDPLFAVLSGGLVLGAFFMATDYVTSPTTAWGRVVFGLGCGVVTFLIRQYGGFPEGVCYAILFMNCLSPLIEMSVKPRRFGVVRAAKAGSAAAGAAAAKGAAK
jgi:Na+-translocating ferredoxin:NAD+ oxidoreductase subunit D